MTGKFISIEGVEGAGKSTQVSFIQQYLIAQGKTVIVTREPGGTELGEQIRNLLLTPADPAMAVETELLLMFAARAEHIKQVINPALNRGDWVLCDRFIDATFAYQGGGRGVSQQRIQALAEWTLQGLMPELTLLFDLPVEIGLKRVVQRNEAIDRFEQEKVTFFEKIRESYLHSAIAQPDRIKVVDASLSIDNIQQQLIRLLSPLL
ncbi:MAG: dTMP kinase [Piscirickettsiaceae bacterium]|jgi:dTMP kinase|nr:dTMP kinase [Piscirickettsiaceae bacterium]